MEFDSSIFPQIKADSWNNSQSADEVFWIVNINELFNVDLSYPGIKSALNRAFLVAKQYVPVDTGITKRSMTQREIDNYRIRIFFDKTKVVGQTRKGRTVNEYYVKYIAESAKRFNWLTICIYKYYEALFSEFKKLKNREKKNEQNINKDKIILSNFVIFFNELSKNYKQMKEEAKKLKEVQKENIKKKEDMIREKKRLKRINNDILNKIE